MRPWPPATLIVMPTIVNHLPHMFYYHKKKGGRNINFKAASGIWREGIFNKRNSNMKSFFTN